MRHPTYRDCAAAIRHGTKRHGRRGQTVGMFEHARAISGRSRTCGTAAFGAGSVAQYRQNTLAPGAARAISRLRPAIDRERRTPSQRRGRCRAPFLIVLPKLMRSGVAPAASDVSISATEAVSKHEPDAPAARALQAPDSPSRRRKRACWAKPGEGAVIVAHHVEIDDEARAIVAASRRRARRNSWIRSVIGHPQRRARFRAPANKLRRTADSFRSRAMETPTSVETISDP